MNPSIHQLIINQLFFFRTKIHMQNSPRFPSFPHCFRTTGTLMTKYLTEIRSKLQPISPAHPSPVDRKPHSVLHPSEGKFGQALDGIGWLSREKNLLIIQVSERPVVLSTVVFNMTTVVDILKNMGSIPYNEKTQTCNIKSLVDKYGFQVPSIGIYRYP